MTVGATFRFVLAFVLFSTLWVAAAAGEQYDLESCDGMAAPVALEAGAVQTLKVDSAPSTANSVVALERRDGYDRARKHALATSRSAAEVGDRQRWVPTPDAHRFKATKGAATFGAKTLGAAEVRILQTGGNKITNATAKGLNEAAGTKLAPREWGRALEALKDANSLPPRFHGKITSTGDYLDKAGKFIGSILEYLP